MEGFIAAPIVLNRKAQPKFVTAHKFGRILIALAPGPLISLAQ
jgi:hypothetical protein